MVDSNGLDASIRTSRRTETTISRQVLHHTAIIHYSTANAFTDHKELLRLKFHSAAPRIDCLLSSLTVTSNISTLPYLTLSCLTLPYLALPHLTLPYLALPYLALPYLALPYLTLPYRSLPCLTSPYLTAPCFALPYLTLSCLTLSCLALPYLT